MPSPREVNKRLIRQAIEANDKAIEKLIELATRFNTTDNDVIDLYGLFITNQLDTDLGRYDKIMRTLFLSIYMCHQTEESMTITRKLI